MSNNPAVIRSIRKLPISLSNQIAAGEVVERPASILKELIENSIDAGALHIRIEIEQAGLEKIKITDDGCGIPAAELSLAVSPHATSKIYSQEQLGSINTLGFRGEALASIASVSKFEITSRIATDDTAWKLDYSNNNSAAYVELDIDKLALLPLAHPIGTTVSANKIFYNTPARKKYLRTERTEYSHVERVIKQMVLSQFNSAFVFVHNSREVYRFQQALDEVTKARRILKMCGKSFYDNSVTLNFEASGMTLQGWLTTADYSRASADIQYFYINGRIIRDRVIFHAIRLAFKDSIPEGRYVAYVLYLTISTQNIDVNVHPTKHEVRFNDLRLVHDFLSHVIGQALSSKTSTKLNLDPVPTFEDKNSNTNSHSVAEPVTSYSVTAPHINAVILDSSITSKLFFQTVLTIIEQRYLLTKFKKSLAVIDIKSARSFLFNHKLLQQVEKNKVLSKPLLIPNIITLEQQKIEILDDNLSLINKVGIDFTVSSLQSVMLRTIPVVLSNINFLTLFKNLSVFLAENNNPTIEALVSVCCDAGSIEIDTSHVETVSLLLSELNDLGNSLLLSNDCDCWHVISIDDLDKLFAGK